MAQAPDFKYAPMFQLGKDDTEYYLLTKEGVSVSEFEGTPILKVSKEALTKMANAAFRDVSFLLRRSHNLQVAKILRDPEASANDKYVALTFLRNAEVAAKGQLPLCQDTGTAIIHGEKGQQVWTNFWPLSTARRVSRYGLISATRRLWQRVCIRLTRRRTCAIRRMLRSICITR